MDAERLHSDIRSQLREDPISTEHLDKQSDLWTLNTDGLPRNSGWIYVLDSGSLQLHVLQYSTTIPLQDILIRQRHYIKFGCTTIGPDFWSLSKTTANRVPSVPVPNRCATNLMDSS